jgi:hypothetical protein
MEYMEQYMELLPSGSESQLSESKSTPMVAKSLYHSHKSIEYQAQLDISHIVCWSRFISQSYKLLYYAMGYSP